MRINHGISAGVHGLLTKDFRTGLLAEVDFHPYLQGLGFEVELDPFLDRVDETYSRKHKEQREQSDAWLAPRLHAALRLTRRQAADRRLWNYLTIAARPAYVRWRFRLERTDEEGISVDRFLGIERQNAFARLWWTAELARNGKDYTPVVEALEAQRYIDNWLVLDAIHHRPAAIAAARFLRRFNNGKWATSEQSRRLAKAFNLYLITRSLDALATCPPVDIEVVREWCGERFDHTLWQDDLPEGPDEEPIPEEDIRRVYQLLEKVAADINLTQTKDVETSTAN